MCACVFLCVCLCVCLAGWLAGLSGLVCLSVSFVHILRANALKSPVTQFHPGCDSPQRLLVGVFNPKPTTFRVEKMNQMHKTPNPFFMVNCFVAFATPSQPGLWDGLAQVMVRHSGSLWHNEFVTVCGCGVYFWRALLPVDQHETTISVLLNVSYLLYV